jgi:hypothetical protein
MWKIFIFGLAQARMLTGHHHLFDHGTLMGSSQSPCEKDEDTCKNGVAAGASACSAAIVGYQTTPCLPGEMFTFGLSCAVAAAVIGPKVCAGIESGVSEICRCTTQTQK